MAPAFTYHIDLLEVNWSALQPISHGRYSGLNRRRKPRARRTFVVSFTPCALVGGLVVVRLSPGAIGGLYAASGNYASRRVEGRVRFG